MSKAPSVQGKPSQRTPASSANATQSLMARVCRYHGGGAQHVKVKAAVQAELLGWGLGDSTVDPGEVLLRLVTQSAARAEGYAMLLEEAHETAERLKRAFDTGALEIDQGKEMADTAGEDLDRIFNTGGVAALVGKGTERPRMWVCTSPVRRYGDLLILRRKSASAARTAAGGRRLVDLRLACATR
jgi:hypothetical protein